MKLFPLCIAFSYLLLSSVSMASAQQRDHTQTDLTQFLEADALVLEETEKPVNDFKLSESDQTLDSSRQTITESSEILGLAEEFFAKKDKKILKQAQAAIGDLEKPLDETNMTEDFVRYIWASGVFTVMFLSTALGLITIKSTKRLKLSAQSLLGFSFTISVASALLVLYA